MLRLLLGLCIAVLCGCSSGSQPVTLDISPRGFAATDARLRVITSTEIGEFSRPGLVDPLRAVCTEPSPDVAVAAANSFSAGLSIFGQGSGSFSASQVEVLAALTERTASIQLIRDKMYQTCLAYANGAISGTAYTLIMSQLDDTIVTLLLGETAGGAFGRSGATIGTAARGGAEASLIGPSAALDGLEDATAQFAEAQAKVDTARAELDLAKEQAGEPPSEADRTEIAAKQDAYDDAKDKRDELLLVLQSRAETSAESAAASRDVAALGGINRTVNPEIARALGQMQTSFLEEDVPTLFVWSCIAELGLQRETIEDLNVSENLFVGLMARWNYENENVPNDERLVSNSSIVAAANANRKSILARFCEDNFYAYLNLAQDNLQEFRIAREQLRTQVLLTEAQSNWFGNFEDALRACGDGTSQTMEACRHAVIAGARTSAPELPQQPEVVAADATEPAIEEVPADPADPADPATPANLSPTG